MVKTFWANWVLIFGYSLLKKGLIYYWVLLLGSNFFIPVIFFGFKETLPSENCHFFKGPFF